MIVPLNFWRSFHRRWPPLLLAGAGYAALGAEQEFNSEEDLGLYESLDNTRHATEVLPLEASGRMVVSLKDKIVRICQQTARPTNAAPQFTLLSLTPSAQASPALASGAEAPDVVRLPGVQVTYSGISETWARRMGRVLAEARVHALREFRFDMPNTIRLTITVDSNRQYTLYNDTRDQLTYRLHSTGDLAGFEVGHWYFIYGLCHEVAHLAMARAFTGPTPNTWLNWEGQEAWARYIGERLADLSYTRCVSEFWPGPRPAGEQVLKADRQSTQHFSPLRETQIADQWRALTDIVGDRGLEPLLETWHEVKIDPQRPADAVSRTFIGHRKAEQLQGWWRKAAPLMLTGPGKSPLFPAKP